MGPSNENEREAEQSGVARLAWQQKVRVEQRPLRLSDWGWVTVQYTCSYCIPVVLPNVYAL
jgi:hypothetical protein